MVADLLQLARSKALAELDIQALQLRAGGAEGLQENVRVITSLDAELRQEFTPISIVGTLETTDRTD